MVSFQQVEVDNLGKIFFQDYLSDAHGANSTASIHDKIVFGVANAASAMEGENGLRVGGWGLGFEPVAEHFFSLGLHFGRIEGGGTPKMGRVQGEFFEMALRPVPAKFGSQFFMEEKKGERFDSFEVVILEKIFRSLMVKKVEQHQAPAAAVGRVVVVF